MTRRPNVVLILADDLGFSDIGCYGGEISTPNLDLLATAGVRMAQFYNTARCSPSRASLLTGLHPHQTGIGVLTSDDRPRGYPGSLNDHCLTIAEVLRAAGYSTGMVGKWHLSSDPVNVNDSWPTRRGFDYFYGIVSGTASYFYPGTLTRNETNVEHEARDDDDYYLTDAVTQEATRFVEKQAASTPDDPFFLYVAYTAPHWPLHARQEDIERYRGRFARGWDELRRDRMRRLLAEGILSDEAALSERDPTQPAWEDAPERDWQERRMEAYAAQVDRMDQGIGRILATLEATGLRDDTMVIFLSDNGASCEALADDAASAHEVGPVVPRSVLEGPAAAFRKQTRDGRDIVFGNDQALVPGGEETYESYGRAWANLSNTPFRFYKRWVHEGGISTPLIAAWPNGDLPAGSICREPFQLTDVVPTILEVTGAAYPHEYPGREPLPLEGRTMLTALRGETAADGTLYWEHVGNAAVRRGRWKLVREYPRPWELYDISTDRSELEDRAQEQPELVAELSAAWQQWADRVGVIAWDTVVDLYRSRGSSDSAAAG
jgi:arylsulfatase A-like enzyme